MLLLARIIFAAIVCFYGSCCVLAYNNAPVLASNDELDILSDSLVIDNEKQMVSFNENVVIIFDKMKLLTSKLDAFYDQGGGNNGSNKKRQIVKILAPKPIRLLKQDDGTIITADSAEFNNITKHLVLLGNVVVKKDNAILSTNKLVYIANIHSVKKQK